ncbi:hypothetical protein [Salimicrobium flavidum]|uniref:ABC-2 family transporter protein n=1 Tax=Salimicrobium flavidum TaxID=570947 RepID=A0A1N7JE61_9BACI|nr:hypothetical protein [Salimicrobium flavidum]SIS47652.1 hypothetical protein SAMN05421687_105126 [Salimicrobium flavidum]
MSNKRKVAFDIFRFQFQWSFYFLVTLLTIYIVFQAFLPPIELGYDTFFSFLCQSAKIFSLIVGIVAGGMFFSPFVRQGVTRKSAFTGNMIAAVLLSLFLMIIITSLTVIEMLIFGSPSPVFGLLPSVLVMILHVFIYYMAGWMITTGYLRFGGFGIAAYILLALLITMVTDTIGGTPAENSLFGDLINVTDGELIPYVTIVVLLSIVTAIILWIGKRTVAVAHAPIKLK